MTYFLSHFIVEKNPIFIEGDQLLEIKLVIGTALVLVS